jgi:hypothetical protein
VIALDPGTITTIQGVGFPRFRNPVHFTPCLTTSPAVCPSRASPPLAVAATPAPPPAFSDPTRHFPALPPPSRHCAVSPLHPPHAPPLPELRRDSHARRRYANSCFRSTTSCSRSRAHPGAPSTLVLALHTHFRSISFALATTTPHPRSEARIAFPRSTEAHRASQFQFPPPELPDHSADVPFPPLPLGPPVDPPIQDLSTPTQRTNSTTSSP